MRFHSVVLVAADARRVLRRFPLVLLSALVAAVAGILALEDTENQDYHLRFLYAASLGLPLFVALTVFPDKARRPLGVKLLLQVTGVAVLVGFFFAWPRWQEPLAFRRYFQLTLGFHLLAAFLPFLGRGELNGFWQYNKTLFIRFLVSALFAAVLFAGLSIAILALDNLFGLEVDGERYFQLWVFIAFVFTTWFFLGGIPDDLRDLETVTDYPHGLRIFSQFILLPLVTIYLVILTLYMGKIAATRVWPSGWIGYLVSSVSVVGILSLLLIFPIQERAENRWVRSYARWFYIVLLPSVAMLLLAIFKRIGQYGITENRYFIVVLSFWLALIALYFIFSRAKSIKMIPATLCVLAFLTASGPWGAYSVSSRSQTHRLSELLSREGVLVDGQIRKAESQMSFEDRREVSAILSYLLGTHGEDSIAGWFEDGLAWVDTMGTDGRGGHEWKTGMKAEQVMDAMGLAYVHQWQREDRKSFSYRSSGPAEAIPISGYDYAFRIENIHASTVLLEGRTYEVVYEMETASLELLGGDTTVVRIPLRDLIERAYELQPRRGPEASEPDSMMVRVESDHASVLVSVRSMSGYEDEGETRLTSFSGVFFVQLKPR